MMAIVRKVSPEIHPFEAAFFRNLLGTIFIFPWIFHAGWDQLRTGARQCTSCGRFAGWQPCCCCSPR
jgi:hypothetical protein